VVEIVAHCIRVQVFRRHLHQLCIWLPTLLRLELELCVVILEGDSRLRHRVRQLLLVIEPPAVIAE